MSSPSHVAETPITDRNELVATLASGEKPKAQWRIGTEHEKFGFRLDDLRPPTFDGDRGIEALLNGLTRFGWDPVQEDGRTIALLRDNASVTLEPAGQLELSGAALETIHQTCVETGTHLNEVAQVAGELQLGFLGMGFQPKWTRDEMPWMPKGRYKIMREYMPKVGTLGLDMMTRTCTVQVNLDYATEADMVKKFRVSLALQPIATALFADSPFTEGAPNGYQSYRSHIWTDTDNDRTGMLDFEPLVLRQAQQMMVFQLRDSVIQVDTFVTEDELRTRYEAEEPALELRARHIMFQLPIGSTPLQRDSVVTALSDVRDRILAGESFETLAQQLSQDPGTAFNGGDLGLFGRGDMVAPFEEAVLALQPGDISDVVETPMGLHIIRLDERRVRGFEDAAPLYRRQVQSRMVQEA